MRTGITRTEVLVLLVIIALVIALGVPYVLKSREDSRRLHCQDNLMRTGYALENFYTAAKTYPPGSLGNRELPPDRRWSWLIGVAHFQRKKADTETPPIPVDFSKPSDVVANLPLTFEWRDKLGATRTFQTRNPFACPLGFQDKDEAGQIRATYVGMAGIGKDAPTLPVKHERAGLWGYDRQTSLADVADGTKSTISVIETAHSRGSWFRGGPATVRGVDPEPSSLIGDGGQFGGFHTGQAVTLFADGSVRFLSAEIDAGVFRQLSTIAGENQEPGDANPKTKARK